MAKQTVLLLVAALTLPLALAAPAAAVEPTREAVYVTTINFAG